MMIRSAAALAFLAVASLQGPQDEDLIKALPNSKHSLREGILQVAKTPATSISAKFEIEDGKLSLSVYTAGKGLGGDAEHNVLQEFGGSPEAAEWKPEVEVFKDVEHVARASQQLTLMALSSSSLVDVIDKVAKTQSGTVYSITPVLRGRKPQFVVLVADKGRRIEVAYDLITGDLVKSKEADAQKK